MPLALHVLVKTFKQLMDARKSRFAPNTPDPLCAKDTRHLTRFVRNGIIQRPPHPNVSKRIFFVCQSYAESHGNIFNCTKTVCMTFKAKSAKRSHPITDKWVAKI